MSTMWSIKSARKLIEDESLLFKRFLDKEDYIEALKHAAIMLDSLAQINDVNDYIEIESKCVDEMNYISKWLKVNKVEFLYEIVQYLPNPYSRLYLLWAVSCDDPSYLDDLEDMLNAIQHPLHGFYIRLRVGENSISKFGWLNLMWVRIRYHPPYKNTHEQIRRTLLPHIQNALNSLSKSPDSILSLLNHSLSSQDVLSQRTISLSLARLFPALPQYSKEFLDTLSRFTMDITEIIDAFFNSVQEYLYNTNEPSIFENCLAGTLNLLESCGKATSLLKISLSFLKICFSFASADILLNLLKIVDQQLKDASVSDCELLLQLLSKVVNLGLNDMPLLITNENFLHLSSLVDRVALLTQIAKIIIPQQNFVQIFSYLVLDVHNYTTEYAESLIRLVHLFNPSSGDYIKTMDDVLKIVINQKFTFLLPILIDKLIFFCYSDEYTKDVLHILIPALDVVEAENIYASANLTLQTLLCIDRWYESEEMGDTVENLIFKIEKGISTVEENSRLNLFLTVVSTLTYIKNIPIQEFIKNLTASAIELFTWERSTAIISCCRLYNFEPKKALICLKKALKIAGQSNDANVECGLILDAVNHIIYLRDKDILEVDYEMVEEVMERVLMKDVVEEGLKKYQVNLNNIINGWNN